MTDKFLRSEFQKLLQWGLIVVSSETSSNLYYNVHSGMKSPVSVGEVPLSKFVSLFGQTGAQTQDVE